MPATTITHAAYFDPGSGWLDEPVININHSAFGSSGAISVIDPRIVQTGYVDGVKESLKAIQVVHDDIADVTITGSYGSATGSAGNAPGGYFEAPDYVSGAVEMGSVAVVSDAPRTIVDGIRVVGLAKSPPGNSGHWGEFRCSAPARKSGIASSIPCKPMRQMATAAMRNIARETWQVILSDRYVDHNRHASHPVEKLC